MRVHRGVHNDFHVHCFMYTPIFDIQVFAMPKLTDMQIRAWIKAGDRFDGKADGNGLYICYPKNYTVPFWRFRYKLAGKQRAMVIGSYSELSLSKARETAKELSARVALGYDVAAEKQERKAEALAKMEAEKTPCVFQIWPPNTSSARYFRDGNIPISFAGELIRILTPALGI